MGSLGLFEVPNEKLVTSAVSWAGLPKATWPSPLVNLPCQGEGSLFSAIRELYFLTGKDAEIVHTLVHTCTHTKVKE